jgi:hypothetical protein
MVGILPPKSHQIIDAEEMISGKERMDLLSQFELAQDPDLQKKETGTTKKFWSCMETVFIWKKFSNSTLSE